MLILSILTPLLILILALHAQICSPLLCFFVCVHLLACLGYQSGNTNAIIVLSGQYMPNKSIKDYTYVMEHLFRWVAALLSVAIILRCYAARSCMLKITVTVGNVSHVIYHSSLTRHNPWDEKSILLAKVIIGDTMRWHMELRVLWPYCVPAKMWVFDDLSSFLTASFSFFFGPSRTYRKCCFCALIQLLFPPPLLSLDMSSPLFSV